MKNAIKQSEPSVPKKIYAQASPHSIGGVSLFDSAFINTKVSSTKGKALRVINSGNVTGFFAKKSLVTKAVSQLKEAGFEVLQVTSTTINIAGTQDVYEKAFNTKVVAEERATIKSFGEVTSATFLDSPDTELPGLISTKNTAFEDTLEGVAIEEPRYFMGASMFAPAKSYWHLRIPGDISLATNADKVHRLGITGKGVKVAMCDSGWYKHPYFEGRGYNAATVTLGPGATLPLKDESGHGTGESANIFAVAPDVTFLPVKMSFVNTIGAFNTAVGLKPHIITCSWGSDNESGPLSAADLALAASVSAAVASGITVIFSAGNGQYGFPGQHPDVIAAGGVYMDKKEKLQASDYASGFISNIYPGRRVPDLCGLVGMLPKASYIMLPVEPGDDIDTGLSGDTHPNGDETEAKDGWAAFSGTSAAAPQLAGAAALIKQANSASTPVHIRKILMKTARDVSSGHGSPRTESPGAVTGHDTATGSGLVDAYKAVQLALKQ
jgi:subtilisin family serine protease